MLNPFVLKIMLFKKLSLGENGRQRTSKKFHDLVLSLKSQNSRVLEILFQALFSRRKVQSRHEKLTTYNFSLQNILYYFCKEWFINVLYA